MKNDNKFIEKPEGFEVDVLESNSQHIVLKKTFKPEVKTWNDLGKISGFAVEADGKIGFYQNLTTSSYNSYIAKTEQVVKSMIAAAKISQLIPYYGGEITPEEWKCDCKKWAINYDSVRLAFLPDCVTVCKSNPILVFHTEEQALNFIDNNLNLLKDYLMID